MKKEIDGKVYDTEKADCLIHFYNGKMGYSLLKEAVYETEDGAYFLEYEGGALTEYAVYAGSIEELAGSEGIEVLTFEEMVEKCKELEEKIKWL